MHYLCTWSLCQSQYTVTAYPNLNTVMIPDQFSNALEVNLAPDDYQVWATFNGAHAGGDIDEVFYITKFQDDPSIWPNGHSMHASISSISKIFSFSNSPSDIIGYLFFVDYSNLGDNHGSVDVFFESLSTLEVFEFTVYPSINTLLIPSNFSDPAIINLPDGTYEVLTQLNNPHAGGDIDGLLFHSTTGNTFEYPAGHAIHKAFHSGLDTLTFTTQGDTLGADLFFVDYSDLSDNYGNVTLTFTKLQEEDTTNINIIITINLYSCINNDTILIPILTFFQEHSYSSAEINFNSYQTGLEFLGIDTTGTLLSGKDWMIEVNETDSLLITASAGAEPISGEGVLYYLKFLVTGEICSFVPIEIESAIFDTGTDSVTIQNGGVYIEPIPDYGDVDVNGIVQAYDASLILKELVGYDTLFCQGTANADVSLDSTISSYDASLILQYVAELIDSLPYIEQLNADGIISMEENINYIQGELINVPVHLNNVSNIISFYSELSYDPAVLQFVDINEWSSGFEGFTKSTNSFEGIIKITGADSVPNAEDGLMMNLRFSVVADNLPDSTKIFLNTNRWNENEPQFNITESTIDFLTGINENGNSIPIEYVLYNNYPNPFNPATTIRYGIPEDSFVKLTVYNTLGEEVKSLISEYLPAGFYSIEFDASNLPSGIYIYRIKANDFLDTKKMILLK